MLRFYMVTQLCFDSEVLLRWLEGVREQGATLPLYAGVPGPIERRKLLGVSLKVGGAAPGWVGGGVMEVR